MTANDSIPPLRDLPPARHEARRQHLLSEITRELGRVTAPRSRTTWARRRFVAPVAVVVVVAAGVGLVLSWERGPVPLVDRALAAVSDGPVIHAVIEPEAGRTAVNVDLTTGRERPVASEIEIWFDGKRQLEHTLIRVDGRVQSDTLQTGTQVITPQHTGADSRPPSLDPGLADFVDDYRAALQNGRARPVGDGSVDGRAVTWLLFTLDNGDSQRVAIDKQTFLPVRVETSSRGGGSAWVYAVHQIEALPEGSGDFTQPDVLPGPEPEAFMREPHPIAPEAASTVIPGALAVGRAAYTGLTLTSVLEAKLSTIYKPDAGREPVVTKGLEFDYGSDSLVDGRPFLWIQEATQANPQYEWYSPPPPPGQLLVLPPRLAPNGAGSFHVGLTVKDGLYLTIFASTRDLLLAAARDLQPF